jgi:molecular chaperone GrpE
MSIQQINTTENDELNKSAPEEPSEEAANPNQAGKADGESEGQRPTDDSGLGDISDDDGIAEWLDSVDPDNILAGIGKKTEDENGDSQDGLCQDGKNAELEDKLADITAQLEEVRDQLLRKTADFENYRKRMNQEKQKAIEFANESLLLDLIPTMDDFERAIQSAEISEELSGLPAGKAMLDGITMIEKQLVSKLENKWGLKRFNCAGEIFDPNLHEAMLMEKSPDIEEPVVQEYFIKGYMLKDRVIRAAKVKVLMPEISE